MERWYSSKAKLEVQKIARVTSASNNSFGISPELALLFSMLVL